MSRLLEIFKNKKRNKDFLWTLIVCLAAHGFLLVATGRWWDDWVYADKNWDYLHEVMRQSSVPLVAYLDASLWLLPDGTYRIIVFLLFFLSAILFYLILEKMDFIQEDARLWIALLYITIPVNDAKITWICFPYTVGLFLWFFVFWLILKWREMTGRKRIILRIVTLLLLVFTYTFLQSTMMMMIPILIYLYYKDLGENWRKCSLKENVKGLLKSVLRYMDILISPIIWYFGHSLLFPGYGVYGGVYNVNWRSLFSVVLSSPQNALVTLRRIMDSYWNVLGEKYNLLFLLLIIAVSLFVYRIRIKKYYSEDVIYIVPNCLLMIIMGFFVFFLAFFPYTVHTGGALTNTYTAGRNTILLSIGTAILIYYCAKCVLKSTMSNLFLVAFIVLGMFHFNHIYLKWQEDYYQQLQLQREFIQNDEIRNGDTFLVLSEGDIITPAFYQTNGNAWIVYGDQRRFFMNGIDHLQYLLEDNERSRWFLNAYMMKEYTYGDREIDGLIIVKYQDVDENMMAKQKFNEFFNVKEFYAWINDISNIEYIALNRMESDVILEKYRNGELSYDDLYVTFYKSANSSVSE